MRLLPRKVGFDNNGLAVGAGFSATVDEAPHHEVMMLPSQHIDWIDIQVKGKTKEQIEAEVRALELAHG